LKRKEIGWTAADWYQRHIELQESEKYPQHESPRPKVQILKENIHQRRLHHGSRQVLDAANKLDDSLKICRLIESTHVPDISSTDYREMFRRYNADPILKQFIESHRIEKPHKEKRRSNRDHSLTEEQNQHKNEIVEAILRKSGNLVEVLTVDPKATAVAWKNPPLGEGVNKNKNPRPLNG
jgi:hypothetical protein